jgi:bacillolysin
LGKNSYHLSFTIRMKNFFRNLILGIGVLSSNFALAQNQRIIPDYSFFIPFSEGKKPSTEAYPQVLKQYLGLSPVDEMRAIKQETDEIGYSHIYLQRYFKGIKVEHDICKVHTQNGLMESINGEFRNINTTSVTPNLTERSALQYALDFVGARTYMWELTKEEELLKKEKNDEEASYYPKGEKVMIMDETGLGEAKIAYKFDVYASSPISRAYIYVDGNSGKILSVDAIIKHANATGTAATRYSSTQTITTDAVSATSYRLRETRGTNSGIQTYNMNKGTNYANAVDFTDADNSWTEYNNTNKDNAALDAHWGAEKTYDYWLSVHGRNSYDNAGAIIKSYVHYSSAYDNAFWDGTRMTYGDGSVFKPLTALDVCGHEIGHAVCSATGNLAYQKESGAINEGLSDIWGACIEFYAAPTKGTWLIGEDIEQRAGHVALRSMSNPNQEGQPDTYAGTMWVSQTNCNPTSNNDYCGVHTNSGVMNYWFYLTTIGGSGTNDIGSVFSVTGIGITDAAKITYRAESVYMTASETYANCRTHTIQAATDLFGAGSAQVIAVTNAWYAVGVGAAYTSGGGTSCGTPASLASAAIAATSATVSWASVTGATAYNVQYKTAAATTWTTISNVVGTSTNLSGLSASTIYNYKIQAVCGTATSAYSTASSFTTSAASTSCTDNYEANNSCSTAKTIPVNTALTGKISSSTDKDYFTFSNSSAARNIKVALTGLPADYDLKFYTSPNNCTGVTTSQNTGTTNEGIIYNNAPVGTYKIQIYGYGGAFNTTLCYNLTVQTSSAAWVRTTGQPEIISEGDIFKEELNHTFSISPNPVNGLASVHLYAEQSANGQISILDQLGREVKVISQSFNLGENDTELDFTGLPNGVYFVKIQIGEQSLLEKVVKM